LASAKWGRYGRRPLVVLCLVGLVDSVDRGVVPAVLPSIQDDLHFGDTAAGVLATGLIVAALLLAVPGGVLTDRLDRRRLMSGVLVLWSAATGLAGLTQHYWQLLTLRMALGAGDAINDPSAQSLVADYYPIAVRGRAYAWQRVVPTVGLGVGTLAGAGLLTLVGWRWTVVAIGLPGVMVALLLRRLPLPPRGEADGIVAAVRERLPAMDSINELLAIPSLRVLLISTAFINGILSALGFWGISYHHRASGMSTAQAGSLAGGVIFLGAIAGGVAGGIVTDKIRGRFTGAPMVLAAGVTSAGAVLLWISFLDGLPVYAARLPLQLLGVALVVSSLPPLTVITAEVVRADARGQSFGLLKLCANVLAAVAPYVIGLISDAHQIPLDDETVGDLGLAFRWTTPVILIGSYLLWRGRHHLDADIAAALRADAMGPVEQH
jgi:MFS family permease